MCEYDSDRVRNISIAMGMTPVIWTRVSATTTFDTGGQADYCLFASKSDLTFGIHTDFNVQGGTTSVYQVLSNWLTILSNVATLKTGFIVLEHDLFEQTVEIATGYILPDALKRGFRMTPVVTCLNKPMSDAYIETNDNKTNPPPASGEPFYSFPSPHLIYPCPPQLVQTPQVLQVQSPGRTPSTSSLFFS